MEFEATSHVGSLFPSEYRLESLPPTSTVREALELMRRRQFSQLPVVDTRGRALGVFSLWALARHLLLGTSKVRDRILEIPIGDIAERIPTVTVEDDLHEVIEKLAQHEALLVGSPKGLQAIATPWDFLVYFYRVSQPYLMLREIELALRSVIAASLPGDELRACCERALNDKYERQGRAAFPTAVDDMEFDDYRALITHPENWSEHFVGVLGADRHLVNARLAHLSRIRNDVFHFRDSVSVSEYETLASEREWLLSRAIDVEREQP